MASAPSPHHDAVAAAIEHLVARYQDQPTLEELADAAGLSPFHFQRVFTRWAGISPKRFLQVVTLGHAKRLLDERESVLGTALEVGLSGPGRLHDLFVACEAMTPGDYKAKGQGLTLEWGWHDSPFGRLLAARSLRGLCALGLHSPGEEARAEAELVAGWPKAAWRENPDATAPLVAQALAGFQGLPSPAGAPLRLELRGTNFQVKVWQALLSIPPGHTASYGDVAAAIGQPSAARAVGAAIARNPIALVIPCHRVIQASGVLHNYRWGAGRKRVLLAWEAARRAG